VPDGNAPENVRETHAFLKWAFEQVRADLQSRAESAEDPADINADLENIAKLKLQPVTHVANAVTHGGYLVGVEMQRAAGEGRENAQLIVTPYYDKAEVPSDAALRRVVRVLEAVNRIKQERMIAQWGIPQAVLEPVRIDAVSVASPKKVGGMVLGTIVPLVLVLMTITGAIYPAIDLTAGERERGTLETLIACPVPPVEVITGKYLVVATVAMLGAALNLASVGATLYFGGFTKLLDTSGQTELPLGMLPVILVALVPFALLFSAIMVAVCSYARTFKEAQNYIVPVILAALIPGGVAALPGTEFGGVNTVVPVMNMVLMARELLLGNYDWPAIALVLVSTSLYAGVSVIIASRVFSTEAAVFADSASLRSLFVRRLIQPASAPSLTLALIVTAVLFPLWMFVQFAIQPGEDGSLLDTFLATARYMPVFLVALPVVLLVYFKIRARGGAGAAFAAGPIRPGGGPARVDGVGAGPRVIPASGQADPLAAGDYREQRPDHGRVRRAGADLAAAAHCRDPRGVRRVVLPRISFRGSAYACRQMADHHRHRVRVRGIPYHADQVRAHRLAGRGAWLLALAVAVHLAVDRRPPLAQRQCRGADLRARVSRTAGRDRSRPRRASASRVDRRRLRGRGRRHLPGHPPRHRPTRTPPATGHHPRKLTRLPSPRRRVRYVPLA
jgi:ABC-type Na+ efflux pump permease subunit